MFSVIDLALFHFFLFFIQTEKLASSSTICSENVCGTFIEAFVLKIFHNLFIVSVKKINLYQQPAKKNMLKASCFQINIDNHIKFAQAGIYLFNVSNGNESVRLF